jgi:hypothetical protein
VKPGNPKARFDAERTAAGYKYLDSLRELMENLLRTKENAEDEGLKWRQRAEKAETRVAPANVTQQAHGVVVRWVADLKYGNLPPGELTRLADIIAAEFGGGDGGDGDEKGT